MSPGRTRGPNPFPGLRPFREDEQHLFFGRERQVDSMVDTLGANRFLAVVGTSGCGKSSLVNCGLLPALHVGLLADAGSSWRVVKCRPGAEPLGALAAALAKPGALFPEKAREVPLVELVDTRLRVSRRGLVDVYESARLPADHNLLVVVDQFEELFRFRDAAERGTGRSADPDARAFVKLLLEAHREPELPIYIVVTMRSDFLGDCARFSGLPEAINAGQFLVPRMGRDERRQAIVGPVAVAGGKLDPVLETRLVNDVGSDPDQLSLLQHALRQTWDAYVADPEAEAMDLRHYEAVGTMAAALDQHAERAYAALATHAERAICERVFRVLADVGTDARGIRRPTALDDICAIVATEREPVEAVLAAFRDPEQAFLMPPADEPLQGDTVIDISHESLMRVWRRLRRWSAEEAASANTYRRLADGARLYADGKASLLRDTDLAVALEWRRMQHPTRAWAEQYAPAFDQVMRYLSDSEEVAGQMARATAEQRRARNIWIGIAVVLLLAVGVSWLDGRAQRAKVEAVSAAHKKEEKARRKAVADRERALLAEKEAQNARAKAEAALATARAEQERAEARAAAIAESVRAQAELNAARAEFDRAREVLERARGRSVEDQSEAEQALISAEHVYRSAEKDTARVAAIAATLPTNGHFDAPVEVHDDDLFSITRGARITATSHDDGLDVVRRMFGGESLGVGDDGAAFFRDGQPKGTVHWVEWEVPQPVTLRSVRLFAAHDDLTDFPFRRAFSRFVFKVTDDEDRAVVTYEPALPYAGRPRGKANLAGTQPGTELRVCFDIEPVTAQSFSAEFTQAVNIFGKWSAPRIYELDGSEAPCPESTARLEVEQRRKKPTKRGVMPAPDGGGLIGF